MVAANTPAPVPPPARHSPPAAIAAPAPRPAPPAHVAASPPRPVALPAAPPARVAPTPPPVQVRVAPTPPPVMAHPIAPHVAPPVARTIYPQHASVPQRQPYYSSAPSYYQQRPYYSQPSNTGFFGGFLGGTALGAGLASLFGRRPQPSSYGSAGAPIARPDPMSPSQFTSFMNAAIEGRENDRTTLRSGDVLPTTPVERQFFKQIVYSMAQRDGKQIDPQGMFTPETLRAVERGQIDPRSLGSNLNHFSDSFSDTAINSRGQAVQSPLANDLYTNYDYLRTQYASEYRQSQQYAAQQRPHQQTASYAPSYQSGYSSGYQSAPYRSNSVIVPIFSVPVLRL